MNNSNHHHGGNSHHSNHSEVKPDFFTDRQEEQLFRQITAEESLVSRRIFFDQKTSLSLS